MQIEIQPKTKIEFGCINMKLTYTNCPECSRLVELNGAGSTANFWQRGLTRLLNRFYPITLRTFRGATDQHDLDYHIGPRIGFERESERKIADEKFLMNCNRAVSESNRNSFMKSWLRYQAEKFYTALRIGGSSAYPHFHCTDPRRKEHADNEHKSILDKMEKKKA